MADKKNWRKRGNEKSIRDVFLRNHGVQSLDQVNDWFERSAAKRFRIDKLDEAAALIMKYKGARVTVAGDFDVDGITASSILLTMLRWLGFKDVRCAIPLRFTEGFGLNRRIVDEAESGLIITCDNGIAQLDAVAYAKSRGIAMVVIDHHEADIAGLPCADVVIDPNAIEGSADFSGYCGAGLCWKLAQYMLPPEQAKRLLPFAALGTIADVVPLTGENYVIAKVGMRLMTASDICPPGLYALVAKIGLTDHITGKDIGFSLAPAVNAMSRIKKEGDGAMEAVKILTSTAGYFELAGKALEFVDMNERRKQLRDTAVAEALSMIGDAEPAAPICLRIPGIGHGIVGLVAGKLCDKFGVPAYILTDTDEAGVLRGSGRSCGNYSMKKELDKVAELLLQYGGHEGAAGLSVKTENFEALKAALQAEFKGFVPDDKTLYDLECDVSYIKKIIEQLATYEPFGEGNPAPVFKLTGFKTAPNRYGEFLNVNPKVARTIAKMQSADGAGAINFDFDASEDIEPLLEGPCNVTFYGTVSNNYYNGTVTPQVEFEALEVADANI